MVERNFNEDNYRAEHSTRLDGLAESGEMDGLKPSEAIKRIMREAIQLGNPFIREKDPFVLMGNDGLDGSWFPAGSFQTVEEAIEHEDRKKSEENRYSGGDDISTTFHVFTCDGIQVRHVSGNEPSGV